MVLLRLLSLHSVFWLRVLYFLLYFLSKNWLPQIIGSGLKKDLLTLFVLALIGVTFFFAIQYTGIQLAGASIAAILVCLLSPLLITVFSARLFGEHLRRKQAIGIGIAVSGTLLVVLGDLLSLNESMTFVEGTLILLSTPVMWAAYSLMGQKIMQKYDAFIVVAYISLLGGLCLIPFSLAENSFTQILTLNTTQWLGILYLAATCSLLGYFIWFYVLKKAGSTASTFLFAEPLVTSIFAVMFVNEVLYPSVIAGAVLIFIGVFLATAKSRKQQ